MYCTYLLKKHINRELIEIEQQNLDANCVQKKNPNNIIIKTNTTHTQKTEKMVTFNNK